MRPIESTSPPPYRPAAPRQRIELRRAQHAASWIFAGLELGFILLPADAPGSSTPLNLLSTAMTDTNPTTASPATPATPPATPAAPPATATTTDPAVADGDKPNVVMCVLSYLGIFALIPFFMKKDDPFIQFNARQGLALFVVAILVAVVFTILGMLFLPTLWSIVSLVINLAILALAILGIVKAIGGERWVMPVVGPMVNKTA